MVPFRGGRVRRRRLLMLVSLVAFLTFYLGFARERPDDQLSMFVPAASPEDELAALRKGAGDTASKKTEDAIRGPKDKDRQVPPPAAPQPDKDATGDSNSKGAGARKPAVGKMTQLADPATLPMVPMEYGTTGRPAIKGLPNVLLEQPVELVVDDSAETAGHGGAPLGRDDGVLRRRRFVFVGDVHGQRKSLDELLDKIGFEVGHDHLILTGDLVNKGPDSAGVVQLAMEVGASAVRGNHDDRVLLDYDAIRTAAQPPPAAPAAHAAPKNRGMLASGLGLLGGGEDGGDDDEAEAVEDAAAGAHRQARLAQIEAEGRMERATAKLQREQELKEEEAGRSKGLLSYLGLGGETKSEEETIDHDEVVAQLEEDPLEQIPFSHGDAPERATAATLTPEQARWLAEQPAILRLGKIAPAPAAVSDAAARANAASPFHDVVVVHAGLVPNVPLARQDPYAVMVMRSLVHPADEVRHQRARNYVERKIRTEARGRIRDTESVQAPDRRVEAEFRRLQKLAYGPDLHHPRQPSPPGAPKVPAANEPDPSDMVLVPIEGHFREGRDRIHWAAAWNQAQHAIAAPENRTTVIYGHDALTGLLVPQPPATGLLSMFTSGGNGRTGVHSQADTGYTFGLDSGAVYGGKLTALIVEADRDGRVQHRIEQVSCPQAAVKGSG